MDEDKFALVEKIIKDVEHIMAKNAELCTFEIVPVEGNFQNKSPVLHIENCLGLESWCIKHVYMYCYSEIMDKYFSKSKRKPSRVCSMNSERLTKLLNITLLVNPELNSLWNKRREMVLKCLLNKTSELNFTKLVLSRKPKCNDVFSYRRWLLQLIFQGDMIQTNVIETLVNDELQICNLTAEKSPNNYHSWNHRMSLIQLLGTVCKQFDIDFLYIQEYEFSERCASKHVSDFSCFHYRQLCIKNILTINESSWKKLENSFNTSLRKSFARVLAMNFPNNVTIEASEEDLLSYTESNLANLLLCYKYKSCKCDTSYVWLCRKLEILFYELVLNNELLRFFKYHETLWYHRRFIVHEVIAVMYEHYGLLRENGAIIKTPCKKCQVDELRQKQTKMVRYDSDHVYSCVLFEVLISHEKKFIEERRNDSDNYADRHEKYLRFVEGLNNVM